MKKYRNMRIVPLCLMILMLSCYACASAAGDKAKDAPPEAAEKKTEAASAEKQKAGEKDPAALVNGTGISRAELDKEYNRLTQRFQQQGKMIGEDQKEEFRKNVLDNLINRELLFQEGEKKGITADEKAVDARFAELKQQMPDEASFEKMLTQMGVSEADIRNEIERGMVIQDFIDQNLTAGIKISDAEIKEFYDANPDYFKKPEQVKASHILIKADSVKDDETAKKEARSKIREVQEKLKKGEDFAELAKSHSQCPSASKGGDLGYFGKGRMVKPFEEAAFTLKPGETSDIVVTQFGYHLIRVTEKKEASVVPLEEAKNKIAEHLKKQKSIETVNQYIEKLKSAAKIETFL